MSEQVCEADMGGDGAAGVDTYGYPVETTGNAVLDILEHRSSTRAFARDDDGRPVAVTDEQRAAILHAASRAPSAGAMMMYSIVSIREQATLDRLADLCDHQPMIAKAPWALIFVVDYAKWIDLFEHVGCFEPEFVERTGKAPRPAPGLGDFAIAAQDAVIAAQNAVVAAEALGLGSCYIGDIVENAEEVAALLDLPAYTMPLSMLIIGTPRKERPAIAHPVVNLVHEERYCRADAATMDAQVAEMDAMFRPHAREVGERVIDEPLYGRDEPLYGVVVQKLARKMTNVTKGASLCHIPYRRGGLKAA